jgi:hypothetical protein
LTERVGILARGSPLRKPQRGRPVRGSTVDGVIGCPAGGDERGGPVCGTGGGDCGGGGDVRPPPGRPVFGDVDGKPVCGWLVGSPVPGSILEGTPTGGAGVSVGGGVGVVPGRGAGVVRVCARAGAAASSTAPSVSATVRACVISYLLVGVSDRRMKALYADR